MISLPGKRVKNCVVWIIRQWVINVSKYNNKNGQNIFDNETACGHRHYLTLTTFKYISVNIGYKIKTYFERSKPFTFTFYRFISCVWSPRLFTVRGFRLVLARHCFIHYNTHRVFRGILNKTNPPYIPPSYQRSFSRRFVGERFRRLFWRYWNAVDIVTVKSISYG